MHMPRKIAIGYTSNLTVFCLTNTQVVHTIKPHKAHWVVWNAHAFADYHNESDWQWWKQKRTKSNLSRGINHFGREDKTLDRIEKWKSYWKTLWSYIETKGWPRFEASLFAQFFFFFFRFFLISANQQSKKGLFSAQTHFQTFFPPRKVILLHLGSFQTLLQIKQVLI